MMREPWHKDRVAVVTGGHTGIGLAIARVLVSRGATVVIGGRRLADPGAAAALEAEIGGIALPLDVTDPDSIRRFADDATARAGQPAILVNAAGISVAQRVSEHDDAAWTSVIDTNLTGAYRMVRAVLPDMLSAGWGRIINIASTAASTAMEDSAAYSASKAGLLGLTRAVALEGAPHGVTCVAVSPTWVETDMLRNSAARMARERQTTQETEIARIAAQNPQGRLVQTSEIAELVSFLCSDHAPGLTMEDIQINAGTHW